MSAVPSAFEERANVERIARERHSQRLVATFVASGILFMLLP